MANLQEFTTPPLSGDPDIDALLGSYVNWEAASRSADRAIQYSFTLTTEQQSLYSNVTAFSAEEQAAARVILAELSAMTGIELTEVADGEAAQLHFGNGELNGAGGLFDWRADTQTDASGNVQTYDVDGYVFLSSGYQTNGDVVPGHGGYQLLLHETGHALGLRHPHDGPTFLDAEADYNGATVMSYNSPLPPRLAYQQYDVDALKWIYSDDGLGGAGARASGGLVVFGDGTDELMTGSAKADYLWGGIGDDTLIGGDGNDLLWGTAGADVMDGGPGNDTFILFESDVISDSGGIDTIYVSQNWTLGADFENLRVFSPRTTLNDVDLVGNGLDNLLAGNGGANRIEGRAGDDRLQGNDGNDTLIGGTGNDLLLNGFGFDSMVGGGGRDIFAFRYPGLFENQVADFESGRDRIRLDGDTRPELGEPGRFAADDGRFYSAPGASQGHDADDRVIWDPSSGKLYFDFDGSGPSTASVIATFQPGATVVATDIVIQATRPKDLLVTGTSGPETLVGGDGDDRLDGRGGPDTLLGGDGNDVYFVDGDDTVTDTSGTDWIYLGSSTWKLGRGTENLLLLPDTTARLGTGNGTANRMVGNEIADNLRGQAGDDALLGNAANDQLRGGTGNDVLIGGTGRDSFVFSEHGAANADRIVDFGNGVDTLKLNDAAFDAIGATGRFEAGDARFYAAAGASGGHDANDRIVYDTDSGNLYYDADGDGAGAASLIATLDGQPGVAARDILVF